MSQLLHLARTRLLLILWVVLVPTLSFTAGEGSPIEEPAQVPETTEPVETAADSGGVLPDISVGNCPKGCVQISGGCSNCNPSTLKRCCTSSEGSEVNCPNCTISCGAGKDCAGAEALWAAAVPGIEDAPLLLTPMAACPPAGDSQAR